MKKLTGIFLVLMLVLSLLPVGVLAQEGEEALDSVEQSNTLLTEGDTNEPVEEANEPTEEVAEESTETTEESSKPAEELVEPEESTESEEETMSEESTDSEEQREPKEASETEEQTADAISLDGSELSLDGATTPSTVTIAQAEARIQNLINMFKGKYFTVNGKACATGSHSECSNCLASSVIATSWVKSLVGMGTMSANNFPAQYAPDGSKWSTNGYSCYGFANFAHWYIFAQKNTDNLVSTLVATGSLTYATVSKAKPGDVIRFSNSWTSGHSVIFISCDSSGFKVLDCNYKDNATGKTACQVKVHTLSYESGGKCAITGVTNYDRESSTVTVTLDINYPIYDPSLLITNQTKVIDKGGTLSSLPVIGGGRYHSVGWYTEPTGGTQVTKDTKFWSNTTIYAHWELSEYSILYFANGGTGAPDVQHITYGTTATLSSVVPTRDGYTFLGWSEDSTATSPTYYSSDSYLDDKSIKLYAIWEKQEEEIDPPDDPWDKASAVIEIPSGTTQPGRTVVLTVTISKNNDGMSFLTLRPDYDKEHLTLTAVENGDIFDNMDVGNQIIFDNGSDTWQTGVLCQLTFEIDADAPLGEYLVFPGIIDCYNDQEDSVFAIEVGGCLVLNNISHGDANGDGSVDGRDVIRLRKYLANYDNMTGISTVEIFGGADANGDGSVDGRDVIRLRRYLANYDSTTGSSTVTLGPTN